jgi:hypothetical protein
MIFKKNKVIFLHYPKTGGNSIQDALRKYSEDQIISRGAHQDGVERFAVRNVEHKKLNKHSTLQDYYNTLGDVLFTYKIFINIRNPYDRMVSFYFSRSRGNVHYDRDDFVQFIKTIPPIENFTSIKKSFFGKSELYPNVKFLKFEKLNEDFDLLLKELELQDIELPHRNASNRENYKKYYDEEMIKIVSTRHKYEISLGNYKF